MREDNSQTVKGCPFSFRMLVKYSFPAPLDPFTRKLISTFPCNMFVCKNRCSEPGSKTFLVQHNSLHPLSMDLHSDTTQVPV